MYKRGGFLFLKKPKTKIDRMYLIDFTLVGKFHRVLLKKKLAQNYQHTTGGLSKNLFFQFQKVFKKLPEFDNQSKLKEDALLRIKKISGYKYSRILKNLPLRGQRTHTNAMTRKKRKVI